MGKSVKRTVLIESTLFVVIGAVGMVEGLRLSMQLTDLYRMLGPGVYIFVLSLALVTLGAVHLIVNYRESLGVESMPVSRNERMRMVSIVVLLCANIFVIELVGYLVASIIFFLVVFRILEVKSWRINIVLSLSLAAVYYVIFVQYFSVIFPQGMLFS
ncbi:MAG: tripartite tricarboxylate transporter TctB family protein [Betaproteobacteria bacterium]|nr:tripartite tricarboxylate transporter TctB family protein [Betaproteobacteria bacterium]